MPGWRFLSDEPASTGAWNMAVDEALLRCAEEEGAFRPVLRLYSWSPPCLSIGHNQSLEEACDPSYCRARGFDVVRRPTGGKAVLHADEITYAVVGRHDLPPFGGLSLIDTYGLIAEALAEGLRSVGLDVSLCERQGSVSPSGGAPCFLVPSEKEIRVAGRKVVGSAQRRGTRAFLQHGAVPLHLDYEALALASGQPAAHAESYRRAFAGVADLQEGVSAERLRAALAEGFRRRFTGPWATGPLSGRERAIAVELERHRYGNESWNRRATAARDAQPGDSLTGGGLPCSN
jgi:lipoate-protein ligase A